MLSDPSRLIAALARDRINLDLKTLDLCFLAGLYLRADRASLASFEEDVLIDMFEQVCDVVDPGAERPRKRATHAIQRLADGDATMFAGKLDDLQLQLRHGRQHDLLALDLLLQSPHLFSQRAQEEH